MDGIGGSLVHVITEVLRMSDAFGTSWNAIVVQMDEWPFLSGAMITIPTSAVLIVIATIIAIVVGPRLLRRLKIELSNRRERQLLIDQCREIVEDRRLLRQQLRDLCNSPQPSTVATVKTVAQQGLFESSKHRILQLSKVAKPKVERVQSVNADNRPEATDASVAQYSRERLLHRSGYEIGATSLYQDYCTWCDRRGIVAVKQRRFGDRLKDLGLEKEGPPDRRNVFYKNVIFKPEDSKDMELSVIEGGRS